MAIVSLTMMVNAGIYMAITLSRISENRYIYMDGNPTAENITKLIFHTLSQLGLRVSRVSLWETPSGCATYSED